MNKETSSEDWAFGVIQEKKLSLGEAVRVRAIFCSRYKDQYPFISTKYKKEYKYYHSNLDAIKHLNFMSEEEVILANAIYENTKEKFNINAFVQNFKFVSRVLNIKTVWAE